jgi:hypothetical protein
VKLRALALFTPTPSVKTCRLAPDRLGRGLQRFGVDAGEGFLEVAHRRFDHVGVKPAQIARFADVLQPARPVRKADGALPDRLAEGGAEILVALEAHLARHAHEGVGLDLRRLGDLAHGRDAHVGGFSST